MTITKIFSTAIGISLVLSSIVGADVVDFTETFDFDPVNIASNWRGPDSSGSDLLEVVLSGGPDGSSYVSYQTNFIDFPDGSGMGGGQPTPVLFRGHESFGSSDGAFAGNWVEDGVTEFSFDFRHNMPVPVTVFSRYASAANFPGAVAIDFAPALPGQWTQVSFDIDPSSPQFISFSGSDFESVFSNIANIQLGVSVPEGFGGSPINFRFDIDNVRVTTAAIPEPTSGLFICLSAFAGLARRKRH